jgi:hypothetical protein
MIASDKRFVPEDFFHFRSGVFQLGLNKFVCIGLRPRRYDVIPSKAFSMFPRLPDALMLFTEARSFQYYRGQNAFTFDCDSPAKLLFWEASFYAFS